MKTDYKPIKPMKEIPDQLRKLRRQFLRYQQAEIVSSASCFRALRSSLVIVIVRFTIFLSGIAMYLPNMLICVIEYHKMDGKTMARCRLSASHCF